MTRFHPMAVVFLVLIGAAPARAQLRCDPAAVDFGRRPENQSFTARVRLTNVAGRPVRILAAQGDCGCLTVTPDTWALDSGQSTSVSIRMQSGGAEGSIEHRVVVTTADGANVEVPVRMEVFAFANWDLRPSRIILPTSRRGEPSSAELRVTRIGAAQPGIASVGSESPFITVAAVPSAGNTAVFRVTKGPGAPAGPTYADIRIATDDASAPVLTVPVFGYSTSTLEVSPNPIVLAGSAAAEVRVTGWDGAGPPRAEFGGGAVRVTAAGDRAWILRIAAGGPGSASSGDRLLLYDGGELVDSVPVVQRP
jgi:hypothetical protein